jgi:hypothetical protein
MNVRRVVAVSAITALAWLGPPANAQTPAWFHQFGSGGYDEAWNTLVVGSTVYVSGWTEGELEGQTSLGGTDGFLAAYDLDGNALWTTQFGTDQDDRAWSLAYDGTGLYLTGVTSGTFPGQTNVGATDGYVAKFDLDGALLWVTQFGTRRDDLSSNVVADASGVYALGSTRGTFDGQTRAGMTDAFHARLDADGTLDWVVQFGSPGNDFPFVNAIGSDAIFVNGYTDGTVEGSNRGEWDAFVAAFQSDGTITWIRQFGTKQNDEAYGLAADANAVYVTGETRGTLRGERHRGKNDAFARALSPMDGSTIWTHQFGTRSDDVGYGAVIDGGTLYAVGSTAGGFGEHVSAGKNDAFAQAIDAASGAKLWTFQFGSAGFDIAYSGWVDASSLYIAGVTDGTWAGETSRGADDALVGRIDLP